MWVTSAVGWAGSALLIYSLMQTRVLRFRVLNLVAAGLLVGFNAAIAVWPMVAMNVVIAGINVWHIGTLLRGRHDERRYAVLPITPGEPYLRRVLDLHAADIRRFNPTLDLAHPWSPGDHDRMAYLVLDGAETVGLVLAHRTSPDTAQIDLDYVLPRYRDFTPGEFVYRSPTTFLARGVTRVIAPSAMLRAERYLTAVGFRHDGDRRVLELAARTSG